MKYISYPLVGLLMLLATSLQAQEEFWTASRPDGHAPIGVMGDHYHNQGDLMLSYRYMPMWMEGNLEQSKDIDIPTIHKNFMVAPERMQMDMHMLGLMYAPSDHLTLMVMGNYISNTMDLQTRMGSTFTGMSSGLGDVVVSGLIRILNNNRQSFHANLGVSIPTGKFDLRGNTPMMDNVPLAYPMQLGSGTWDPVIGATYLGQLNAVSWGVQVKTKWHIGENSKDYTLGNNINSVAWTAVKASDWLSFSASLAHYIHGTIRGANVDFNPRLMPLFDAANSGRQQLDLGIGSNFYIPSGPLKNVRIGVEFRLPLYQHVIGIQMKNKSMATAGLQYSL